MPYSGPLAPPTEVTRVMPTFLRSVTGVPRRSASTAAITASMPRIRLAPWSASPIAESSSVRYVAVLVHGVAERGQPRDQTVDGDGFDHAQTPHRRPAVSTGASHRRMISSSALSTVTEAPAMSREVM